MQLCTASSTMRCHLLISEVGGRNISHRVSQRVQVGGVGAAGRLTGLIFLTLRPPCPAEPQIKSSAGLEKEDGHLAQVEVDEMLRLVGDVAAEVPAHDTVPCGVVLLVKLLQKGTQTKTF